MLSSALVLCILLPAVGAVVAGLATARAARLIAVIAAGVTAAAAGWAVAANGAATTTVAVSVLTWLGGPGPAPVLGATLDPLAAVLLLVSTVIGFLTVLYATRYLSEGNREHAVAAADQPRFYFWLLLFLAAMTGLALAPNFLQLLFFWELTTVCSWALISYYRSDRSLKAGFKALVMTQLGGACLIAAVAVLFAVGGSSEFSALAALPGGAKTVVFALMMVAAWAKAGQLPFSTWLPDAMEAPTPISAYLHAAAMVKAGVFLMARAASAGWAMPPRLALILGAAALLTLFVALSFYFVQDDLKRLLAYSTVAHLATILLGIALGGMGSVMALRGGVLHLFCHAFAKGLLFFCVGAIAYSTGSRTISTLGGLSRAMPLTATAFFVGVLAVSGVPPFACFWSKLMILSGAAHLGGAVAAVVITLVLLESLISLGWLLYVGQRIFFGAPREAVAAGDPPAAMSVTLLALTAACLLAPAIGLPLVSWVGR